MQYISSFCTGTIKYILPWKLQESLQSQTVTVFHTEWTLEHFIILNAVERTNCNHFLLKYLMSPIDLSANLADRSEAETTQNLVLTRWAQRYRESFRRGVWYMYWTATSHEDISHKGGHKLIYVFKKETWNSSGQRRSWITSSQFCTATGGFWNHFWSSAGRHRTCFKTTYYCSF